MSNEEWVMGIKAQVLFVVLLTFVMHAAVGETDAIIDLHIGGGYESLRIALLEDGWVADEDRSESAVDANYPEVSCGSGRDAVCSAGFQKGRDYVALILTFDGEKVVVKGRY